MDDKQQFIELLQPVKRQLFLKRILTELQYWLLLAAAYSLLILLAATVIVLPYYHKMILSGCGVLFAAAIFRIWHFKPGLKEAALTFNGYIPEDRVVVAYNFLGDEGLMVSLQRAEVLPLMKKEQKKVLSRKKHYLLPKWLTPALCLGGMAILLNFFPNQNMHLAGEKEKEMAVLKKAESKLAKQMKKEEKPLAKKELAKAKTAIAEKKITKEALAELGKQMKELELKALKEQGKQNQLLDTKEELRNSGLNDLAKYLDEKDTAKMKAELARLNKNYDSLSESQKKAFEDMAGSDKQLSDKELKVLAKKLENALNAEKMQRDLADAQSAVAQAAFDLQSEMAVNHLKTDQLAFTENGQNANSPKSGTSNKGQPGNGTSNNGSNPSSGTGNANNPNNGNGNGTSTDAGTGAGNGSGGTGNGTGSGKGASLGSGSRYLLTVPEKMDGETNIEKDTGSNGKGSPSEQYEGNGPVLKGHIRSYEEVYGSYLASYRKSTDRVKLPSDLESIVKNYFSVLDPNKE